MVARACLFWILIPVSLFGGRLSAQSPVTPHNLPVHSVPVGVIGGEPVGESRFQKPFTAVYFAAESPEQLTEYLDRAAAADVTVFVSLSSIGQRSASKRIPVDAYRADLLRFKDVEFGRYVESGTIAGHLLLGTAYPPAHRQHPVVDGDSLSAAASTSRELFPELPRGVMLRPSSLIDQDIGDSLDFAIALFAGNRKSVTEFLQTEKAAAAQLKLKLAVALNALPKSERPHDQRSTARMNADLGRQGREFVRDGSLLAVLFWPYHSGLLHRAATRAAVQGTAKEALFYTRKHRKFWQPRPEDVPELVSILRREGFYGAEQSPYAMDALITIGPPAVDSIIRLMRKPGLTWIPRYRCVRLLGRMGPDARSGLAELKEIVAERESHPLIRRYGPAAIAAVEGDIAALTELLDHKTTGVAGYAAARLADAGEAAQSAIPALQKMAAESNLSRSAAGQAALHRLRPQPAAVRRVPR